VTDRERINTITITITIQHASNIHVQRSGCCHQTTPKSNRKVIEFLHHWKSNLKHAQRQRPVSLSASDCRCITSRCRMFRHSRRLHFSSFVSCSSSSSSGVPPRFMTMNPSPPHKAVQSATETSSILQAKQKHATMLKCYVVRWLCP